MPLLNNNPTKTEAWRKLLAHYQEMESFSIQKAFQDHPNRKDDFSISFNDLSVDYSKNRINQTTLDLLVELANELDLKIPLVVRLEGTNVELGKKIMADSGLAIISADNLGEAAEKIVAAVRGDI